MKFITWQEWYSQWKDKKSLNEITHDYTLYSYQYDVTQQYEESLRRLGGGETQTETATIPYEGYLLTEGGGYLLQEDGSNIYL
jgi:hypothetical protein